MRAGESVMAGVVVERWRCGERLPLCADARVKLE
jgi:hypothetical protein